MSIVFSLRPVNYRLIIIVKWIGIDTLLHTAYFYTEQQDLQMQMNTIPISVDHFIHCKLGKNQIDDNTSKIAFSYLFLDSGTNVSALSLMWLFMCVSLMHYKSIFYQFSSNIYYVWSFEEEKETHRIMER